MKQLNQYFHLIHEINLNGVFGGQKRGPGSDSTILLMSLLLHFQKYIETNDQQTRIRTEVHALYPNFFFFFKFQCMYQS